MTIYTYISFKFNFFVFIEFIVKIIQLYYNDDYEEYKNVKEENITDLVCV
jgi:hypothetical protein